MALHPSVPGMLFHTLHRAHHNAVSSALAACGLQDVGSPMILFFLSRCGEAGTLPVQRELADALHISPASVAMSLKSLDRLGYVARQADATDARRRRITITEKGREAVAKCITVFDAVDERMFCGFTPEESAQLACFHQKMLDNLLEHCSDGSPYERMACPCSKN